MCMTLLAALDVDTLLWYAKVIPAVAIGLGAVIFVHELGHFLVAKACGVKCEKFMIGFDVGGYKISRKWGETEYGIGLVPLGGYVKMLGQDDNPANIAEQMRESQVAGNSPDAKEVMGPDGKTYLIDRRSYLAKSVPQRMAIISAGVIMNIIFAFIFATVAYKLGVPYNPSVVSQTAPGSPAWQADIRPGDQVIQIADIEQPSFDDLRGSVTLSDLEAGLPFTIRRGDQQLEKRLYPEQDGGLPRVGIAPPLSLRLLKKKPAYEYTAASAAKPALEGGDEVLAVDGEPVASYAELSALLLAKADQSVTLTVRRGGKPAKDDPYGPLTGGETVEVTLPPQPYKDLGLVMEMGKVTAVQENSPAKEAGLERGAFIDKIADAAGSAGGDSRERTLAFDPMTLPEALQRLAEEGRDVELTVRPAGKEGDGRQQERTVVVPLRRVEWVEGALGAAENSPVVATALGVSYSVLNVVDRVEPGSPAAEAGLESGDVVTQAEFEFPADLKDKPEVKPIEFSLDEGDEKANWPAFTTALQAMPAGTKVKLTYKRGEETKTATLAPVGSTDVFLPERGIVFDLVEDIRIASTWGEAIRRGREETISALGMVYRFLGKLGHQVSFTSLGGPVTIAQAAGFSAAEGPGKLLIFLTMLSANLAVINFLPIPLLDGGHMVFLLWEGIRGKPAGEKFVMAMHTAGFVFIITLMLFVLSLDFGLIPRNL
jgi:regulator of sigma E protease